MATVSSNRTRKDPPLVAKERTSGFTGRGRCLGGWRLRPFAFPPISSCGGAARYPALPQPDQF